MLPLPIAPFSHSPLPVVGIKEMLAFFTCQATSLSNVLQQLCLEGKQMKFNLGLQNGKLEELEVIIAQDAQHTNVQIIHQILIKFAPN